MSLWIWRAGYNISLSFSCRVQNTSIKEKKWSRDSHVLIPPVAKSEEGWEEIDWEGLMVPFAMTSAFEATDEKPVPDIVTGLLQTEK